MFDQKRKRARQHLDQRLTAEFKQQLTQSMVKPPRGYIRAIRDAIGMTAAQLGARTGILPQSVLGLEKSEELGTISLKKLRHAAEAMDCRLVYALVPITSLEHTVNERAKQLALKNMQDVRHTMILEDQEPNSLTYEDSLRQDIEIATYIDRNINDRDLWADDA